VSPWLAVWSKTDTETSPVTLVPERSGSVLPGCDFKASKVTSAVPAPGIPLISIKLPPRQTQVMRLLSEGKSVKEIARHLNLGPGTIKVHLSLAYSSLGARNRVEAVNLAAPLLLASAAEQNL